jgi:hypothetical protein
MMCPRFRSYQDVTSHRVRGLHEMRRSCPASRMHRVSNCVVTAGRPRPQFRQAIRAWRVLRRRSRYFSCPRAQQGYRSVREHIAADRMLGRTVAPYEALHEATFFVRCLLGDEVIRWLGNAGPPVLTCRMIMCGHCDQSLGLCARRHPSQKATRTVRLALNGWPTATP